MPNRLRRFIHIALTVISFATTGRAPRLIVVGARELATLEESIAPGSQASL